MSKIITAATIVATLSLVFALSTTHAGGGMGAGSGLSTCRLVLNGSANQPQTVGVIDPFVPVTNPPTPDAVKVNALALICDLPATGRTLSGPLTGTPVPDAQVTAIACYTVSGADSARIPATVHNPFTEPAPPGGLGEKVALGAIQLLCVPVNMTNP